MKHLSNRLTYANVMVTILAFIVLGGGAAFAALGKGTVGTPQLKKNAVKVGKIGPEAVRAGKLAKNSIATNRYRDNSVSGDKVVESTLSQVPSAAKSNTAKTADSAKTADTAASANTAKTADTAASANNADNSQKVGGKSLNDIAMWAFVNDNGALLRSSGGVASANTTTGTYNVVFPRNINTCAYNATNAANDNADFPAPQQIAVSKLSGPNNVVRVRTSNSGGTLVNDEFMLVVTC